MPTFKDIRGIDLRRRRLRSTLRLITLLCAMVPVPGYAGPCLAPARPFLPSDARAVQDYANILRRDFDAYITEIQAYFRCLDAERARAFEEARAVSEDYGRFLQLTRD